LKPRKGTDLLFLYFMLRSDYVLDEIKRRLRGATIPSINESSFEQIELPLPPIQVQCKIADILKETSENAKDMKTQAKSLIKEAEELDRIAENEFVDSISN
jgi:restriction endonuclease S subunit